MRNGPLTTERLIKPNSGFARRLTSGRLEAGGTTVTSSFAPQSVRQEPQSARQEAASSHPILQELEALIDRAWEEDAAERMAARTTLGGGQRDRNDTQFSLADRARSGRPLG
jgi:hypothetical protein